MSHQWKISLLLALALCIDCSHPTDDERALEISDGSFTINEGGLTSVGIERIAKAGVKELVISMPRLAERRGQPIQEATIQEGLSGALQLSLLNTLHVNDYSITAEALDRLIKNAPSLDFILLGFGDTKINGETVSDYLWSPEELVRALSNFNGTALTFSGKVTNEHLIALAESNACMKLQEFSLMNDVNGVSDSAIEALAVKRPALRE